MKLLIFLFLATLLYGQTPLPSYYHTQEEINSRFTELSNQYPDIVKVMQIGTSSTENIPIYALKLSDNAQDNEPEPGVLFVGLCHAEEVLGVEAVMAMIEDIIEKRTINPYNTWLSEIEIYFVPSINPEGHNVVTSGVDRCFRKNKRDNNNNGFFDYEVGPGNDIDGVDINRNYGFNWIHGDTLYCPDGEERYDYYRGSAPFSEGGTQAIRNLAAMKHFIFSINFHSSRTGNLSEKLFYSFEFDDDKKSVDYNYNKTLGEEVAALIDCESGIGTYEPSPSRGRNGSAHDWFYQSHGTTQFLIECGTSNLQPDSLLVVDTINRLKPGAYHLLNKCLGLNTESSMIKGIVSNSVTGEPVHAKVRVLEKDASYFEPRMTDPEHGKYFRQITPGNYNFEFSARGYETQVVNKTVNITSPTNKNISMVPKESAILNLKIQSDGLNLNGKVKILGDFPYEEIINSGIVQLDEFVGPLSFEIHVTGYTPIVYNMELSAGLNDITFDIEDAVYAYYNDFQDGFTGMTNNGFSIETVGKVICASDSPDSFYENDLHINMITDFFSLSESSKPLIELNQKYHTEHDYDLCNVYISENGNDFTLLKTFSGVSDDFELSLIDISSYAGKTICLKFAFDTDGNLDDPGWFIDYIKVYGSGYSGLNGNIPMETGLIGNYPNPFNPNTLVKYKLSKNSDVNFKVFNNSGELVRSIQFKNQKTGIHSFNFNGSDLSSGIYFYTMSTSDKLFTKKMVLIK
ncbi:MAG: T9SS type A sorting domain-containing protein [Candidatus Delongbacteria bacterium]|nr:T9SS type A sorting domain-containing protein [Candidatus Delongbacteria bacterium]MBN2834740.1 T9SS type A sorting domain-containing protein [Candidatus Delongbacteria bacterium]